MDLRRGVRSYNLECRFDEPIAVHVVETESHVILFGGGDRSTQDRYMEIVEEEEPDVIIVEHGDPDHYGALPPVLARSDQPKIAVPSGDASFLSEADIDPDILLEPDTEQWGIRTISVPGHTPDNMAYFYGDVLIAGDSVVGSDSPFAAEDTWSGALAVITEDFNYDDARARESVRHMIDHTFDTVLVTHGSNVLEGGKREMQRLIDDLARST